MFFPIGDENVTRGYRPFVSYLLIAINILVFLYQVSLGASDDALITLYGSVPAQVIQGHQLYTLFTCIFLHGGWMHLIGNLLFLWVFADNIEASIGSFRFTLFYIAGGIVAGVTHTILAAHSLTPCVGASGAIAACLGAYIIMFPGSKINVLFLIIFRTFRISAIYFLGFWIVQQLMSGMGTLGTKTADAGGVAYWAHIGGFVFGLVCGWQFQSKTKVSL